MSLGYKYNTVAARELRKKQTLAEELLWNELRNRKLDGYKFKRQHPISKYIADFYCSANKLVIEVDGSIHETKEQIEKDEVRDEVMIKYNFKILRFENKDVIYSLGKVLNRIRKELNNK